MGVWPPNLSFPWWVRNPYVTQHVIGAHECICQSDTWHRNLSNSLSWVHLCDRHTTLLRNEYNRKNCIISLASASDNCLHLQEKCCPRMTTHCSLNHYCQSVNLRSMMSLAALWRMTSLSCPSSEVKTTIAEFSSASCVSTFIVKCSVSSINS